MSERNIIECNYKLNHIISLNRLLYWMPSCAIFSDPVCSILSTILDMIYFVHSAVQYVGINFR